MTLPADFLTKYGPWAVVTGASSGIGAEFARQLAGAGLSLVLVARRKERIDAAAKSLMQEYPIQVKAITADLTSDWGVQSVIDGTASLDVGLLVNNAGMAAHGSFFQDTAENHARMITLNVTAVTALAYAFGMRLGHRRRGGVIFTSSIASIGFPYFATYASTKAYVSMLSLMLRRELGPRGVDVLCLEPGVVKSKMSDAVKRGGVDFGSIGMNQMRTEDCVEEGLRSLYDGKPKVTPGFMNKFMQWFMGLLPQQVGYSLMDIMMARAMPAEAKAFPEK